MSMRNRFLFVALAVAVALALILAPRSKGVSMDQPTAKSSNGKPSDAELKTLARVWRAPPEAIERRVVVDFNGDGIWFGARRAGCCAIA